MSRWKFVFIGNACFHLLYNELISQQLEVDNVFISINLRFPSVFVPGYEDGVSVLLEGFLIA